MSLARIPGLKCMTMSHARERHAESIMTSTPITPVPAGRARGSHRDGVRLGGERLREPTLDVVIVGGGPAGLSAALVLGRARRRVLVLDTGRPANAASTAVGGLLAQVGVAPSDLRREGRAQLAGFPNVEVRDGAVI